MKIGQLNDTEGINILCKTFNVFFVFRSKNLERTRQLGDKVNGE